MTNAITFTASTVFEQVNLSDLFSNGFACNAVVEHVADYFADIEYSSIDSLVRDLEMAHWAAGSLGLINYSEVTEFLNDATNRDDVEEVFEDLLDNMGELIEVRTFHNMLVYALDHACNAIASLIDRADLSVVINAVDYLDPNPEVIITDDPDETVADVIRHRVEMEVSSSTHSLTHDELDELQELITSLVRIAA